MNLDESLAKLNLEFKEGFCSHPSAPEACSSGPIRAHSLQKATALKAIAENGHVYTVLGGMDKNGARQIKPLGIHRASTFFGFCNYHDTTMFKPIETGKLPLDRQAAFLLSFRAVAMEVLMRGAAIRGARRSRSDAGMPLREQQRIVNDIETSLMPLINGQKDFAAWKNRLDLKYKSKNYEHIDMVIVEFDGSIPLVAASAILPWFDFHGNIIQDLIVVDEPDVLAFSLTYSGNNSILVFCWEGGNNSAGQLLVDDFLRQPDDLKATAAAMMALGYTENLYMRPSWWEALASSQQSRIREIMDFGTGGPEDLATRSRVMNTVLSPFKINVPVKGVQRL